METVAATGEHRKSNGDTFAVRSVVLSVGMLTIGSLPLHKGRDAEKPDRTATVPERGADFDIATGMSASGQCAVANPVVRL